MAMKLFYRSFKTVNENPIENYRSPKYVYTDMSKYYQKENLEPEKMMNEKRIVPSKRIRRLKFNSSKLDLLLD
jgi:hypothetical protein